MTTLTHRGYAARVEFDADDEIFTGCVAGISDSVGFHADTAAELKSAFREAVDDYLDTCARIGRSPDKPYSGKMMFRVPPEVHARAALAALVSGKSLNQWATDALNAAAELDAGRAVGV